MFDLMKRTGRAFALMGFVAMLSSPAAWAVHDDGNLELDGDTAYDGNPATGIDWENIYDECGTAGSCTPVATGASRQSFQTDVGLPDSTAFSGGIKDIQPISAWTCDETQVQGKSDIQYAYGAVYDNLGEKILYSGMDRRTFNGTSYMGVWLLQAPAGCESAGAATPFTGAHLDGDLLLIADYVNGGVVTNVNVYRWTDPDFIPENGDECLGGARGPIGDECVNVDLTYFSSVNCDSPTLNDPPINDALCGISNGAIAEGGIGPITPSWRGEELDENGFFETGINLTAFSLTDTVSGSECYSSVLIETRSSASLTADLKDFVFLDLATCGTVTIEKVTNQPVADLFNFTIDQPAGADNTTAFSLAGGDSIVLDAVESGTYVFTEGTLPSEDWTLESISCNTGQGATDLDAQTVELTVTTETDIVCTFTNNLAAPPGTLLISKSCDSLDNGGQTFDFTITGPEGALAASTTAACQDGAVTLACGESVSCQELEPGQYTVDESEPTDWNVTGVTCTGGSGSTCSPAATPRATVTIGETEETGSVTVSFENTEDATIEVCKATVPNGVGGDFDFTATWSYGNFALADAECTDVSAVTPDTSYDFTEAAKAGYTLTGMDCTGSNWNSSGSTITVTPDPGEAVSCTFTNSQEPGSITVCKETIPAGATGSFEVTLSGPDGNLPTSNNLVHGECDFGAILLDVGSGYSVAETFQVGWELTSATCSDGSSPDNIELSADEDVICTLTNTRRTPAISITKSPNSQTLNPGETANFTILVTNTGEIDLENVAVTDAQAPDCDAAIGDLAIGADFEYSCSLTNVQAGFVNVADVIGYPVDGNDPVEDSDTAAVTVYVPPTAVPVDGKWALLLLALSMLAIAWYRRPLKH